MRKPFHHNSANVKTIVLGVVTILFGVIILCIHGMRRDSALAINKDVERRRFVRRITQGQPRDCLD